MVEVTVEQFEEMLAFGEGEHCEFKEARNRYNFEKLVKYCAALANEGGGKVILGVTDKRPRTVVGSQAFRQPERTRAALIERLHLNIDFSLLAHSAGRVLIFHVPTHPIGNPVQYNYSINSAWLVGAQYTFASKDFSKILTLQANYKYIKDKNNAAFQLTAVWTLNFFKNKLSLLGFADWWREDNVFGENTTNYVFLTEPQIWWNAMEHFSFGGEFEMSNNFASNEGFMFNPTVAVKWIF